MPSDVMREQIEQMLDLDDAAFESALNDFLGRHWPTFQRLGWQMCRRQGRPVSTYGEDFTSLMAAEMTAMIRSYRVDPSLLDEVRKIDVMVMVRCRNAARSWIRASESPASGMSSRLLVHSMLHSLYWQMYAETGNEPTVSEVVEAHNAKMRATRKNPVRSGVIATEADYWLSASAHEFDERTEASEGIEPDCMLAPFEGPKFQADVVSACIAQDEELGCAASAFLDYIVEGGNESGSVGAVQSSCQVSRAEALRRIGRVQEVAREVAMGKWGISGA